MRLSYYGNADAAPGAVSPHMKPVCSRTQLLSAGATLDGFSNYTSAPGGTEAPVQRRRVLARRACVSDPRRRANRSASFCRSVRRSPVPVRFPRRARMQSMTWSLVITTDASQSAGSRERNICVAPGCGGPPCRPCPALSSPGSSTRRCCGARRAPPLFRRAPGRGRRRRRGVPGSAPASDLRAGRPACRCSRTRGTWR